jgi:hypothetical protein
MPVIHDIPLSLKAGEVLRRGEFRGRAGIRPEIKGLILELLVGVEEAHLLEPAIAYEIYPAGGANPLWSGTRLALLLPRARELAIVVGTIGPRLEARVAAYNSRSEPLRGVLLDGVGSAAVDALTQEACELMTAEASPHGYQVSSPINPGMPGLPLTEQRTLLEMVPAREIGVSLTSSGMLVPRKSVSMVIGMGPEMKTWTRSEVCARCNLGRTCHYRIPA